jgi:hypothetical protein
VLVVTSTERVLYRVFGYTTNLGPGVPLNSILVVSAASLQERLIGTSSSGDNTNLGTDLRRDGFLATRRKAKTSGALVIIMRDDNSEAAGSTSKGATVTNASFDVAHNGTLRDLLQRKNIAACQGSLLSAVDELSSVHSLGGNHELGITLETVGIQELDLGHGSSTTRVMKDLLDDTTDVTTTLGVVDGTKLHGSLAGANVGFEDGGFTPSLGLSCHHFCFANMGGVHYPEVHKWISGIAALNE